MGVVLQQCGLGAVVLYSLISLNLPDVGRPGEFSTWVIITALGVRCQIIGGNQAISSKKMFFLSYKAVPALADYLTLCENLSSSACLRNLWLIRVRTHSNIMS